MSSWITRWRVLDRAEEQAGFRDEVLDISARGLRLACWLGIGLVLAYVTLQVGRGRGVSWVGSSDDVALWDKVLTVFLGLAGLMASRTPWGRRLARPLVATLCLAAALASTLDDLSRPDTTFTTPWIAAALFVGITAVPFRPWQAFAFSLGGTAIYVFARLVTTEPEPQLAQGIFILLFAALVVTMSVELYGTRFERWRGLNDALQESQRHEQTSLRLQRLERMKSRFFLGISHDVRAPLSLVKGPVQDLTEGRGGELPERARHLLDFARHGAAQLEAHIEDLLDLAKLDVGELPLQPAAHDMVELARTVVEAHRFMAERAATGLQLDASGEAAVVMDPARMRQVLENLVTNGLRYAGEGGRVVVRVRLCAPEVQVEVADDGLGVSEEDLPHVFERFYRSPDAAGSGIGLGLSIAAEIVRLHEGAISVSNSAEGGAVFRITLPAAKEAPVALPPYGASLHEDDEAERSEEDRPMEHEAAGSGRPAHTGMDHSESSHEAVEGEASGRSDAQVLIVEDNEQLRGYMATYVGRQYAVIQAADGLAAWEWLASNRPSLVISDVMMPRLNGIDLCRKIRHSERLADLPVVLLTAKGDEESKLAGLEAGADDYLLKPFNSREVMVRCENLIELRRRLRQGNSDPLSIQPSEIEVTSADERFAHRVREVVESLMENANFGVDWLADEVGLSTRQLHRRVRKATGLSAAGLIRMLRLGRAAQLLKGGAANVSEAAHAVGLRDVDHFTRLFRQAYGMTPSSWAATA